MLNRLPTSLAQLNAGNNSVKLKIEIRQLLYSLYRSKKLPNKQLGQLINISPHSLTMMNTVNTEFYSVKVWFMDQVSKTLEIEDNVNLVLIIG